MSDSYSQKLDCACASNLVTTQMNPIRTLTSIHVHTSATAQENKPLPVRLHHWERYSPSRCLGKLQYRTAVSRCSWQTWALNPDSRDNNRRFIFIMSNTSATFLFHLYKTRFYSSNRKTNARFKLPLFDFPVQSRKLIEVLITLIDLTFSDNYKINSHILTTEEESKSDHNLRTSKTRCFGTPFRRYAGWFSGEPLVNLPWISFLHFLSTSRRLTQQR